MQPEPGSSPREPDEPRGRTARRLAVIAAVVVALVGGGTAAALLFRLSGSAEQLLDHVPADVHGFVTVYLDPGAGQKLNLRRVAGAFPALGGAEGLDRRTDELLDEAVGELGLDFHDDVEPWLGSQIGFAFRVSGPGDPAIAMLIDSADDDLAAAALDRAAAGERTPVEGVDAVPLPAPDGSEPVLGALVEGAVVVADDRAFLADVILASRGDRDRLGDSTAYEDTVAPLPASRLVLGWIDAGRLAKELAGGLGDAAAVTPGLASGAPGLETLDAIRGMGFTLSAEAEGLAISFNQRVDPEALPPEQREALEGAGTPEALLPAVPADAFALMAFATDLEQLTGDAVPGLPGIGESLQGLTGEVAIEVGPGGRRAPAAGAVLLGVDDPEAVRRTLAQLETLLPLLAGGELSSDGGLGTGGAPLPEWQRTEHRGTEIRFLELPDLRSDGLVPAYAVTDALAVVGSSVAEVRQVLDTLSGEAGLVSADRFARATGPVGLDATSIGFLDVEALLGEYGEALPPEPRSNVAPIRAVAGSSRAGLPDSISRAFVLIEAAG